MNSSRHHTGTCWKSTNSYSISSFGRLNRSPATTPLLTFFANAAAALRSLSAFVNGTLQPDRAVFCGGFGK